MIDMKKINELRSWYRMQFPGLDFYVQVVDPDEVWDELLELEQPIVTWSIDAFAFFAHEYFLGGCHGCDTDEVIHRLNKDITCFLQKEEVKQIISENRFNGGWNYL